MTIVLLALNKNDKKLILSKFSKSLGREYNVKCNTSFFCVKTLRNFFYFENAKVVTFSKDKCSFYALRPKSHPLGYGILNMNGRKQ